MYDLILYIPTYNRLERLRMAIGCIAADIAATRDGAARVHVVVSNNGSPDGTRAFLDALEYPWLTVLHNAENRGFFLNAIRAYDLPVSGRFVWAIGDDDYLVPGALEHLLGIIAADPALEFIFCNTAAFEVPPESQAAIHAQIRQTGLLPEGGKGKCKLAGPDGPLPYGQLVRPDIADTLMGELMVNCFAQARFRLPYAEAEAINARIEAEFAAGDPSLETEGLRHQPHNYALLRAADGQMPAYLSRRILTYNFWGTVEWLNDYDYIFPVIVLYLITEYRARAILPPDLYRPVVDWYFRGMGASLLKQVNGTSTAKPIGNAIKAELFALLLRFVSETL